MALAQSKGRKDVENSGYFRLFAEDTKDDLAHQLAEVLSKIQACVIRNGCSLETDFLCNKDYNPNHVKVKSNTSSLLDDGHYCKFKILSKDHGIVDKYAIEIDYMTVHENIIELFEIKDGDNFDTKKSLSEYQNLCAARDYFIKKFPTHVIDYHQETFHQNQKLTRRYRNNGC